MRILITGSTGYVGGRLVPRILELGHDVTVLVRDEERIRFKPWINQVSVIEGDLTDANGDWMGKLEGFEAAYYLVHSIYSSAPFEEKDPVAARNFAKAARGTTHTIYLGGLVPNTSADRMSKHLYSRAETGEVLSQYLPMTEFRAGPIIGSGSTSFEMVRYLTERLPVMITPKWVSNYVQPIGVRDMINYLVQALEKEPLGVVDLGTDVVTFRQMMLMYAKVKNLKRWVLPVPLLTPNLTARWVGLITPISNRMARPLIEGITHSILADTRRAKEHFPDIHPISYEASLKYAISRVSRDTVETHWSNPLGGGNNFKFSDDKGMLREARRRHVNASQKVMMEVIKGIGGKEGWPSWGWAWRIRGTIDKILGGPGLKRGRKHTTQIHVGDVIDFWRVERVTDDELLLRAEMRLPGKAWLQFQVLSEEDDQGCRLFQNALFEPHGLLGIIYWYCMFPAHLFIFDQMIKALAKRAEDLNV